jgi:hypothetical protein
MKVEIGCKNDALDEVNDLSLWLQKNIENPLRDANIKLKHYLEREKQGKIDYNKDILHPSDELEILYANIPEKVQATLYKVFSIDKIESINISENCFTFQKMEDSLFDYLQNLSFPRTKGKTLGDKIDKLENYIKKISAVFSDEEGGENLAFFLDEAITKQGITDIRREDTHIGSITEDFLMLGNMINQAIIKLNNTKRRNESYPSALHLSPDENIYNIAIVVQHYVQDTLKINSRSTLEHFLYAMMFIVDAKNARSYSSKIPHIISQIS